MITREQARAKHALENSRKMQPKDAEFSKKLPVLIQTCGLAQAMAFAEAKDKALNLRSALEEWIQIMMPPPPSQATGGRPARILPRILAGEPDFLFRATDEALAYLFWMARFLEVGKKNGAAEGGPRS